MVCSPADSATKSYLSAEAAPRGHGDAKLVENVSNAPSFVAIGQVLPKMCFRKSCAQIAYIGVGAENWRDAGTSDTRANPHKIDILTVQQQQRHRHRQATE